MLPEHRPGLSALLAALDTFGANLAAWPDAALADEARRRLLTDAAFREQHAAATAMATLLDGLAARTDTAVRTSGAERRVAAAVVGRLPPVRQGWRLRWAAAAIGVAGALGSLAEIVVLGPGSAAGLEIVVLEPLLLGPSGLVQ